MPLRENVTEVILDESEMHSAHLFVSVAAAVTGPYPPRRLCGWTTAHISVSVFAAVVSSPPFSHHQLRLDGMDPIDPCSVNGRSTTDHDGRPLRSAARWSRLRVDVEGSSLTRQRSAALLPVTHAQAAGQSTVHASDSRCSCAVLRSPRHGATTLRMRREALACRAEGG